MMENTFFISDNEIKVLSETVSYYLSKDVKKQLKDIQTKYSITFTLDRKTNSNILWEKYHEIALKDCHFSDFTTNLSYANLYKQSGNRRNFYTNDMLKRFVDYNYKEENQFVFNLDFERLFLSQINMTLSQYNLHYHSDTLTELLECNDYFKLFSEKFGIGNVNKKEIQATKKVLSFFEDLLREIPNKAGVFSQLVAHFEGQDLAVTHRNLFRK